MKFIATKWRLTNEKAVKSMADKQNNLKWNLRAKKISFTRTRI
jgi:hypothetical protein